MRSVQGFLETAGLLKNISRPEGIIPRMHLKEKLLEITMSDCMMSKFQVSRNVLVNQPSTMVH